MGKGSRTSGTMTTINRHEQSGGVEVTKIRNVENMHRSPIALENGAVAKGGESGRAKKSRRGIVRTDDPNQLHVRLPGKNRKDRILWKLNDGKGGDQRATGFEERGREGKGPDCWLTSQRESCRLNRRIAKTD